MSDHPVLGQCSDIRHVPTCDPERELTRAAVEVRPLQARELARAGGCVRVGCQRMRDRLRIRSRRWGSEGSC